MEIIRGSLDDISRPASNEQTGGRVSSAVLPNSDRNCPTSPFALVVLTNESADIQIHSSFGETISTSSVTGPEQGQCHDAVDGEGEDSELYRATEEMRRLEEILSAQLSKEKEVMHQRKELQAKLWEELRQNKPEGQSECAHEALNTRLFLALEAASGTEEEENFGPLFETQVPDSKNDRHKQVLEQSEKRSGRTRESFDTGKERFESSCCEASKGKKKQKDFVKRNIELVGAEDGQVHFTQAQKERLAELLREIDEEEEDSARGAYSEEDMWGVSVLTGQGYTPEPSDLEQLTDIDSKMRLLLPVEEFLLAQSSCTNCNVPPGHGAEVGWKCDGDPEPGEKVLQDIKERRGQERRLQEIQQQLEILGQSQERTDESPGLTEEQLLCLLDECELTESWSQDAQMTDTTP